MVIETGAGGGKSARVGLHTGTTREQLIDAHISIERTQRGACYLLYFARIQFQRARGIGESESVDHLSVRVGKCLGFENIEAETGERRGDGREQERSVIGDYAQ